MSQVEAGWASARIGVARQRALSAVRRGGACCLPSYCSSHWKRPCDTARLDQSRRPEWSGPCPAGRV